jgi:hypothetical protein
VPAHGGPPQVVSGGDKIGDICGEACIENSPSLAPMPVKSQHRNTARSERLRDAAGSEVVLAASKAMGKQRISGRLAGRTIEQRCQSKRSRAI